MKTAEEQQKELEEKKEILKKIEEQLSLAKTAIQEAQRLADENALEFHIAGLIEHYRARSFWYQGKGTQKPHWLSSSWCLEEQDPEDLLMEEGQWVSSSDGC